MKHLHSTLETRNRKRQGNRALSHSPPHRQISPPSLLPLEISSTTFYPSPNLSSQAHPFNRPLSFASASLEISSPSLWPPTSLYQYLTRSTYTTLSLSLSTTLSLSVSLFPRLFYFTLSYRNRKRINICSVHQRVCLSYIPGLMFTIVSYSRLLDLSTSPSRSLSLSLFPSTHLHSFQSRLSYY